MKTLGTIAKTKLDAVKSKKEVSKVSAKDSAKVEKDRIKATELDLDLDTDAYGDLDAILHEIETSIGLSQVDINANKVKTSTGLLALDLMTAGGLVSGGWYTFFGGEQSCKSTLASTQLANAITTKIPYLLYFDYEGSFSADYFMSIARHVGAIPPSMLDSDAAQRIFGLQDEKGNWVIKPRVKYYPLSIGEKFFDYMARLLRQLPDKLYKDGKWWLVYEPDNKLHKEHVKKRKPKFSEALWKKTGKWWVETDNGLPQALAITDSYPAMNPERMDVDDPSAAMAMQARMFADNIKRIKGKMSAKRVTVMGINQLRLRPGVSYGCFHANTNILLADGTTKTIKNIVDNKLKIDVLSYNPQTKKVESQPVTGWYNNGRATQDEWLRFKVKTIVQGKGPRFDLKVTKNHLLMDAKGYLRRAHTFEVGDKFLHVPNQQQLGETQRQLFLGSVLGDGWFIPGPADLNSCGLGIAHAKSQFQYLKWKYQILKDITVAKYRSDSGISTIETVKIGDPWFIDVYTEARLGVTGLRDYRVSPSLLSQISPLGLAVWAMDDASRERWQLKMQSYSIDDAQAIIDNLNSRFNLKMPFSVWADNNSKTGKGWGTNLKRDFMDLISPYVHDTFSESFERNELGIFTGYSKERDGGFYTTTAVITAIAEDTVTSSDKYDIQVANNHLYVADGVVVENSPEYEPCFIGSTVVHLANGTTDTIRNIVNKRSEVEVLSFDKETGEVSAKKIIDWKDNGLVKTSDLVKVKYHSYDTYGIANVSEFTATKNHKIWTSDGWVQAGDLTLDSNIYLNVSKDTYSEDQKQVIYGSLLGDGVFASAPNSINWNVHYTHARNQVPYMMWKAQTIDFGNPFEVFNDSAVQRYKPEGANSSYLSYKHFNKEIAKYAKLLKSNQTTLTEKCVRAVVEILDKLDLRGLAIWYQDDGHFANDRKNGLWVTTITCDRFPEELKLKVIQVIKDLTGAKSHVDKTTGKITIKGKHENTLFQNAICDYMHIAMSYKLFDCSSAGCYQWEVQDPETINGLQRTKIVSVTPACLKSKYTNVYDLTVEDNHTYFVGGSNRELDENRVRRAIRADGIAVSNCGEALKFNCFSADTLLQTSKGLMYADELYHETRKSNLPLIQGVGGLEQPQIYDFMGSSELIEVKTRDGFKLKGKPGHRVKALKKDTFVTSWTSLKDLACENLRYYIPVQLGANVFNCNETLIDYAGKFSVFGTTVTFPTTSSVVLAKLLGYVVLFGTTQDSRIRVKTSNTEQIKIFSYFYAKVFNLEEEKVSESILYNSAGYDFLLADCAQQLLNYVGLATENQTKQVPWIIRQGTKEEQSAFLSVLFSAPQVSFFRYESSEKFTSEVQQMLLNFGVYSSVNTNQNVFAVKIEFQHAAKFAVDILGSTESIPKKDTTNFDDMYKCEDFDGFIEKLQYTNFELPTNFDAGSLTGVAKDRFLDRSHDLKKFIRYTQTHNLIWLEVESTNFNFEKAPTFDANMPDTHTIITNGFVSHNSDVRIRMASRSVQGGTGQFEEEPGINGGIDQYRYIHMRAAKNKLSVPNLEGWARIWVKDAEGQAHGFDPVYDVFSFLREVGLVTGTKNKLKISIPQMAGHKPLSWLKFKKIILGDKKMIRETLESVGVQKPFFIRQELFKMFEKDGKAMEMFFAKRKADVDKKGKDTDDDSDE